MTECHFCGESVTEKHHIVPQRFGGSDKEENLVSVCPTCHRKLESLYDKRFYDELDVQTGPKGSMPMCEFCGDNRAVGQHCNFAPGAPPQSWFSCAECAEEAGVGLAHRVDT